MKMKPTIVCLTAAVVLLAANFAQAGTYWDVGTGNWSTGSNWTAGEPGTDDGAYIINGGTAQITAPNDEACYSLRLGKDPGDSGTVDMTGGSLSVSETLKVGNVGNGTLNITGGGAVSSKQGSVGGGSGSTGAVTVQGTGSTWTNTRRLYVGDGGNGTLNILAGGQVTVGKDSWVGGNPGSSGTIHFDNGTLTTDGLACDFDDLTGTGTINTSGLVTDADLVFDATHGLNRTFTIDDNPGQNITLNLDVDGSGVMGAGYRGHGTMSISNGTVVKSYNGDIGYWSGSTGAVTVEGAGSTWTNSWYLNVGHQGEGTLNITGGGAVGNWTAYIGGSFGSTGAVTVDGAGSKWTNWFLYVGRYGHGTLDITAGGQVTVGGDTWVSQHPVSSGTMNFDNGTVTTGGLACHFDDLTGTGTINTHGLLTDADLVFDATHGLNRIFTIDDNPGQNITLNLNVDGSGVMGAGYAGDGTMRISDGRVVQSTDGYIGYKSGSTGAVRVQGAGSRWTNRGTLSVGYYGDGTLNITGGAAVSNDWGYIGYLSSGSTGAVTVEGAGSTWTNTGGLYVGRSGPGTLNISGGGLVSVADILTIDADGDGDSFINMTSGGMLALFGEADDSLGDFLALIDGTDAIRYWDDDISDWDWLTNATLGEDYDLSYLTEGDLSGYTMLTVPEPATISLLALAGLGLFARRKKGT